MAMALSTMRMAVFDSFLADSHRRANRGRRLDLRQWSEGDEVSTVTALELTASMSR
ncbi:hypothetical protein C163_15620 [Pseudomonas sp. FGI182]|nr:hypothetical protein C163_15620 [Pseudomonas sp. FGI182]